MQCQKIRIRCPTKVASVFNDTSMLKTKKEQPKQATLLFRLLLPAEREGFFHSKASQANDNEPLGSHPLLPAEREGFEPPVPLSTPVFKTGAIDHSAISPK